MIVLKIGGGAALSAFRLDKLNAALQTVQPGSRVLSARHWHFVEVDRPLDETESGTLDRLLTYGARLQVRTAWRCRWLSTTRGKSCQDAV
jgi:urease beta subunit